PGRPPGEHKVQTILEADPTAVVVGVSSMHLPRQCICQALKTRPRICSPGSTHLLGNGGCIHKWWKRPGRDMARQGWIFRLTVDDALSPLVFSGGIYKPLGPGCTGPCGAKSAAVRVPPTTIDPAHSGKDPQREP